MGERQLDVSIRVNGEDVRERVEARKTLVDFLREDLGLTGSHIGCEQGVCGACTVLVDGEVVRGCLMLAVQCDVLDKAAVSAFAAKTADWTSRSPANRSYPSHLDNEPSTPPSGGARRECRPNVALGYRGNRRAQPRHG